MAGYTSKEKDETEPSGGNLMNADPVQPPVKTQGEGLPEPIGQPMQVSIDKLVYKVGRQLIELDAYAERTTQMALEITELRAQVSACTCTSEEREAPAE